MDLILIRHGQSQYNFDQTGGVDAPLTTLGREQARRAGIYCRAQFHIAALYASTYGRARDTAEIINSFLGLPAPKLLGDLREFSEDYTPMMPQFDTPLLALRFQEPVRPVQISEYYNHFQDRVQRALEFILLAHQDAYDTDAQIGIVSHGGVMGTIMRTLVGNHTFSLTTENTGIYVLRWQYRRWHVIAINRVEHLECDRWLHEPGKDA